MIRKLRKDFFMVTAHQTVQTTLMNATMEFLIATKKFEVPLV